MELPGTHTHTNTHTHTLIHTHTHTQLTEQYYDMLIERILVTTHTHPSTHTHTHTPPHIPPSHSATEHHPVLCYIAPLPPSLKKNKPLSSFPFIFYPPFTHPSFFLLSPLPSLPPLSPPLFLLLSALPFPCVEAFSVDSLRVVRCQTDQQALKSRLQDTQGV